MNQAETILKAEKILFERRGRAIIDVSGLEVYNGEILSLIGPNGAGKSTLMLLLASMIRPSARDLFFKGARIDSKKSVRSYRRRISMVFQEPLLLNTTVFRNVAVGLRFRGIGRAEINKTVMEYLELFGISHLSDRRAKKLSGGESQRTSLARAFAIKPDIIFLDEPFASLDPPIRESLLNDLERILRQTRTTAVISTHDRYEALRLSDRIAMIRNGKIVQVGGPLDIINRPVDESAATFVGVETILDGRVLQSNDNSFTADVKGEKIEAAGHAVTGENVLLCVRPENVTISTDLNPETVSARNVFRGRIIGITLIGPVHKIDIDCGFHIVSYITKHAIDDLSLSEGMEITASFKATAIHVIRKLFK
jgi:tungstate transport system ATP-binding protein